MGLQCSIVLPSRLPSNIKQLRKLVSEGASFDYEFFWNGSPFSQWNNKGFILDGIKYHTAEHYMMAEKAKLFGDNDMFEKILAAKSPADAKLLGRKVKGFKASIWDEHKVAIVLAGNIAKVNQNIGIKECLLSTYDRILVEASPYDSVWGIGLACNHPDAENPVKWRGQNLLGFILTAIKTGLQPKETL